MQGNYQYSVRPDPEDMAFKAKFYNKRVTDEKETEAKGRVIKKDVLYFKLVLKGQIGGRGESYNQPVKGDKLKEMQFRFPDAWDAYTKGEESVASGTPLAEVPTLAIEEVEMLNQYGFFTVEEYADAGDNALKGVGMTARTMQKKCKTFLDSSATYATQTEDMRKMKDKIEALERELEAKETVKQEQKANKVEGKKAAKKEVKNDAPNDNTEC